MEPLLPEFDPACVGRLWVAIRGDRACLAALAGEFRGAGAETREQDGTLTLLMPAAAEVDRMLAKVAERIDQATAGGRSGATVAETRIVPAGKGRQDGTPARIGDRFQVAPAGLGHGTGGETILLTGGGVFGSGFHPSTRLAVRALEELAGEAPSFPERALDVGTGSGLLALIAARLGAGAVLGIDIAPEAVAAARRNVAANGLGARVRIEATPLAEVAGRFDLILANLTASVQLRLAEPLRLRLAAGELIVSGLQGRQQEEMASFWQGKGLRVVSRFAEGRWRALRLRAGSCVTDSQKAVTPA